MTAHKEVLFTILFISLCIMLPACNRQEAPGEPDTVQSTAVSLKATAAASETAAEESTVSAAAKTTAVRTKKETTTAAKVTVKPTEKGTASTAAKPTTEKPAATTPAAMKPTTEKPTTAKSTTKQTTAKPTRKETEKPTNAPDAFNTEYAADAMRLVNGERKKAGLKPLAANAELQRCANIRAKEIVKKFSHTRPNGKSCFDVNYDLVMGENIASGQRTPQEVVDGWMNSPAHRENILRERFTLGAVGCYYDSAKKTYYWVQLFG